MVGLNTSDRLEKWQTTLAHAQRCLHGAGCLAVLCDEGQCQDVKGIMKDKLLLQIHHDCYYMTMPFMMVIGDSFPLALNFIAFHSR